MIYEIRKKIGSISVGVKASLAYFLANMLNKAIAYLTTPLYTNLMSSEEYGQVSLFMTWVSLIGIVAMFSFQAGVFNNGMIDYPDDRDNFSFSLLMLSNIITLAIGGLIIIGFNHVNKILKLDLSLTILMIVIFMLQPAYNFWITRQRFEYKYKSTTVVMVVMNILSPAIAILLIKNNQTFGLSKVYARVFGAQCVFLAFYVIFYIKIIFNSNKRVNTKYWKFALLFNLPLIPHYLSQYLMSSADKIMISNLLDDSQTAYYSVAYSVAAVVSIVWTSINASLVPYSYQKCKEARYKDIANVVYPLWISFALICLILMIIAPELISFLAPKEYEIGKYVIPPVIGGVFFQALYYTFANVNYYYKKTRLVMYASLSAAVINIILNYILIPRFGFIAAGYTTLISYVIQALIDYIAIKTVIHEDIFSKKIVVCLSGAVIVSSCLFPLVYNLSYVRYGFIASGLFFVILFRSRIIRFVRSLIVELKGVSKT